MKRATEKQTARPVATSGVKVRRYFPGKAPDAQEHDLSASDSEGEAAVKDKGVLPALQGISIASTNHSHGDVGGSATFESDEGSDSEVERVLQARLHAQRRANEASSDSSDEEESVAAASAWQVRREPIPLASDKASSIGLVSKSEASGTSSGSDGSFSDSESDSGPEQAPPPMLKPIFVPRSQRLTQAAVDNTDQADVLALEDAAEERERLGRREESVRIAAAEAARAREAPEISTSSVMDLDDTDGVDVAAEFEAWRQRELLRIKREKDAREAVDLEEAERERRNNMSEGEKYAEDMERVRNQRREKAQELESLRRP
ncbi:hypothetical protein GGI20_002080 [Coemansia sp. BCRC 34301]|nr:hypothetical protein GGI20_002080 [Coemansia sp. BCRC 34301]